MSFRLFPSSLFRPRSAVTTPFQWIDHQTDLDALVKRLKPLKEVPLDTEADNMYHYHNRICLYQLQIGKDSYIIDALADLDLKSFVQALGTKVLIMHGSDFDLRLMADHYQFRPAGLFDTMLAAQLLGHSKTGLGSLIEHYFDVELPKGHQKSDWSKRPLPEKMLLYAAEDVVYLQELRKKMAKELKKKGRMDWLDQRCAWQIDAALDGFTQRDEHAWRVSGSHKLGPRGLAVLFELWHWRERSAEKADLPPFKILNNPYLVAIAASVEQSGGSSWQDTLPPRVFTRHRKALEKAVNRGEDRDPATLPRRKSARGDRQPLSNEEIQRQEEMRGFRDARAEELGIDPSLIANRSQLTILARDREKLDEILLPWQADLLRSAVAEN